MRPGLDVAASHVDRQHGRRADRPAATVGDVEGNRSATLPRVRRDRRRCSRGDGDRSAAWYAANRSARSWHEATAPASATTERHATGLPGSCPARKQSPASPAGWSSTSRLIAIDTAAVDAASSAPGRSGSSATHVEPLRCACYGHVDDQPGSVRGLERQRGRCDLEHRHALGASVRSNRPGSPMPAEHVGRTTCQETRGTRASKRMALCHLAFAI